MNIDFNLFYLMKSDLYPIIIILTFYFFYLKNIIFRGLLIQMKINMLSFFSKKLDLNLKHFNSSFYELL